MKMQKTLSFLVQAATIGLLAAFLILLLKPEWFRPPPAVVELRQSPASPGGETDWSGPVSYADAVARAAPAVVNVYTSKLVTQRSHPLLDDPIFRHFFGDRYSSPRQRLQTSLGSGVIVSEQGYVLTNHHVIEGADEVQIQVEDGRRARAEVVGSDPETDLAVLRVELGDLPAVVIGKSDRLRVGDVLLAIGNPFGVGQTVTQGIVSATGRNQLGISTFEDFIQTDAAINPGNSGGALINAHGELVGINTAIYSKTGGSQGIGFAIPIQMATGVMKQIVEEGQVIRGWLGIEAQDLTPALAESFGLDAVRGMLIAGILRGGPADKAGLEPGDVILAIDGEEIADATDAMGQIAQRPPGTVIELDAVRQKARVKVSATVARRPAVRR